MDYSPMTKQDKGTQVHISLKSQQCTSCTKSRLNAFLTVEHQELESVKNWTTGEQKQESLPTGYSRFYSENKTSPNEPHA